MTTHACTHTTGIATCDWCQVTVTCSQCWRVFGVSHRLEYVKDESLAHACDTCYRTVVNRTAYARVESYANNKEDIVCNHPNVIKCRSCSTVTYCYVCRRAFVERYHQTEERDYACDDCATTHNTPIRFSFTKDSL